MSYDHGPCYFCNKKSCKNCPSAVAKVVGDTYFTSPWVFEIEKGGKNYDELVERLWKENIDIMWDENENSEMVLGQNWRGFPVGSFTQDDWFRWVDAFHSKGVGWVYENVRI